MVKIANIFKLTDQLTDHADKNEHTDHLARLNHYLQHQLHRNLKTEELAELLDMGQTSLYNFVKKETGFCPCIKQVQFKKKTSFEPSRLKRINFYLNMVHPRTQAYGSEG